MPEIIAEIEARVKEFSLQQLQENVSLEYFAKIHDRRRLEKAAAIFLQTGKHIKEWQNGERDFQLANFQVSVLMPDRAKIWQNIEKRLDRNLDVMIDEVAQFNLNNGINDAHADISIDTIGYEEITQFLKNSRMDKQGLRDLILYRTRQYSKRQTTYIRNCLDADIEDDFEQLLAKFLAL